MALRTAHVCAYHCAQLSYNTIAAQNSNNLSSGQSSLLRCIRWLGYTFTDTYTYKQPVKFRPDDSRIFLLPPYMEGGGRCIATGDSWKCGAWIIWSKFHRLLIRIGIGEGVCEPAYIESKSQQRTRSFRFEHSRSRAALPFWRGGKLMARHPSYRIFFSLSARQRKRSVRGATCVEVHANLKQTVSQSEHTAMTEADAAWHWFIRRT